MKPLYETGRATLYRGDALDILREMPAGSVDAVITDPPYSSGGMTRGDRVTSTGSKYTRGTTHVRNDFAGDNRDQRSYGYWCALWLAELLRIAKPGGVCALWTDWRQLPATTDALQAGGWVWRGIAVWNKTNPRPCLGRPTQAAEFVVWGTRGARPVAGEALPGSWTHGVKRASARAHQTEKPLGVLADLVRLAPPGGLVLDPFAGSATTGIAAIRAGRSFLGIELTDHYAGVAAGRLAAAELDQMDGHLPVGRESSGSAT